MSNVLNQYVWFGLLKRLTTKSQNLEQKIESLGAEKVQLKFANTFLGCINQQQIMQLGQNLISSQLKFIKIVSPFIVTQYTI